MSLPRLCRLAFRAPFLIGTLALITLDYLFTIRLRGLSHSIPARAVWLQRQCRRLLRCLGLRAEYHGTPPSQGVLVCNHLGYTDILVLGARHPLVFISKAEVAGWPVFGMLSKFAGTLFIRRDLRSDVVRIGKAMEPVVQAGCVLAFFPEGTSTGGDRLLPFHASLFAPLAEHGWDVTPAAIRYALPPKEGTVENDVAYWREDQVFGPHLLRLLGAGGVCAQVTYGPLHPGTADRKTLARELRAAIGELANLSVV